MPLLDPKYKLKVHILQIVLVHLVIGVSAPQLFLKGQPRTRANTIAMGMGGKSMIIIFYQIMTEHFARFSRWKSYKAYAILNGLEIVFWAAVIFLVLQANIKSCVGISCTLRWIAVSISVVITIVAVYMFIISYMEFRLHRMLGQSNGRRRIMTSGTDVERSQSLDYLHAKSSRGIDPEGPSTNGHSQHRGQDSARRLSTSPRHSQRKHHHSRRHSMTGERRLSESGARRHSAFRGHSHGEERRAGWESVPPTSPGNHQSRRRSRSRDDRGDYDRRAHDQGHPRPPSYHTSSFYRT